MTAKKCNKIYNARAGPLFFSLKSTAGAGVFQDLHFDRSILPHFINSYMNNAIKQSINIGEQVIVVSFI